MNNYSVIQYCAQAIIKVGALENGALIVYECIKREGGQRERRGWIGHLESVRSDWETERTQSKKKLLKIAQDSIVIVVRAQSYRYTLFVFI